MAFKSISQTLQKLIIDMFDKGHSIYNISEELMLDRNTVYKYLLREGKVEPDPEVIEKSRRRYTDEDRAEVVRLYNQGFPVKEISERVGMSVPSIYNHVKKQGKIRKTTKKDFDKAIKMYQSQHYSVLEILEKTGVPRASFYKELKERRAKGEID